MRDFFQEQLHQLNQEMIRMGAACEEIIELASRSLTDYSADLAKSVSAVGAAEVSYRWFQWYARSRRSARQPH